MSYRPPRKSQLVAPVSQRVAVVLAAWLPDAVVFRRTATMPEDLRAEVLATVDGIKAAAIAHKQAFAEVGNRPTAITPEAEESEVKGTPPDPDPAGLVLLRVDEAAGRLSLSETMTRRLCRSGELEAKKHGVSWMIASDSIDNYLATRKAA